MCINVNFQYKASDDLCSRGHSLPHDDPTPLTMLLLLLLPLFAFQQTFADVCEVCGSGLVVTNSEALVEVFGQGSYSTCTDLQQSGLNGHIPKAQCDTAPLLIFDVCRCAPTISLSSPELDPRLLNVLARVFFLFPTSSPATSSATPTAPTSAKQVTAAPTGTSISTIPTPTVLGSSKPAATQSSACYICGEEGSKVSLPNAIINVIGEAMTCSELETLALGGGISPEECPYLPVVSFLTCGCSSPTSSQPAPSSVPNVSAPSPAPFSMPVDAFPNQAPTSTTVDSTPSPAPIFTQVFSTPSPAPISTPVDTSSRQPTSLPTPDDSAPSPPTQFASSPPSNSLVSDCGDGSGSFGDTSGSETEVEYLYEAITTPETVETALRNILTTTFEPALGTALISGIFSSVCSRRLQWRRRLEVKGLSVRPNDELIESGTWMKLRAELVECRFSPFD
jgi:hypothetical protein